MNSAWHLIPVAACMLTASVHAEVSRCGGVWTTGPCDQEVTRRIAPPVKSTKSKAHAELSQKKILLHELNTRRLDAQKEYDFVIDVSHVQRFCLEEPSSLKDCQIEADRFDDRLQRRVEFEINKLESQKLKEEAKPPAKSVVYIDNRRPYHRRYGKRHIRNASDTRKQPEKLADTPESPEMEEITAPPPEKKAGSSQQLLDK